MDRIDIFCQICVKNIPASVEILDRERHASLCFMFTIFKLSEEFQLPERICLGCCVKLEECHRFHQQILHAREQIDLSTEHPKPIQLRTNSKPLVHGCDHCDLRYETDHALQRHRKLVHFEALSRHFHYCETCNKYFKTGRGLQQHSTYCHDSNGPGLACGQCQRDFTTRTSYLNHIKHHKDYVCNFCDHAWNSERKLVEHVQLTHTDRLFHCKKCSRTERLRKCLNRHQRTAHGIAERQFYCGHCPGETCFENLASVMDHVQESHKELEDPVGVYSELLNDTLFSKDVSLVELEPACDKLKRDENQEIFLKHFNLVRTVVNQSPTGSPRKATVNPNKMILEEFLDEAFENDQIWTKYIEGGEEYLIDNYEFYLDGPGTAKPSKYKCPRCEEGFSKQYLLTVHLAEIHKVACLICNDCGASFNKIVEYKNHRQEHLKDNVRFRENIIPEAEEALSLVQREDKEYVITESGQSYSFTCKLCHRSFAKKCNLQKHQCSFQAKLQPDPQNSGESSSKTTATIANQSSTLTDSLFCTLCDKTFTSISGLKYHLKRHADVKAFPCLYCSKKFTANSNLNAHIRNVHSEVRSHICPECDMRFACKDHLTKHVRSKHRKDRAFACPECPKSYFQRSHLTDHVDSVHAGYKAYSCRLCAASYSCKGSLRRHMAKVH